MSTEFLEGARIEISRQLGFAVGDGFALSFPMAEATFEVRSNPDRLDIAYLAADPMPPESFWGENAERGTLRTFRVPGTRSRHLERLASARAIAFDVVRREGVLVPVLIGSAPDALGVYSVPDGISAKVQVGEKAIEEALEAAAATLEAYSAWQDGMVCGIVIDRFQIRQDELDFIESEPTWCQLGPRGAARRMKDLLGALGPAPALGL